MKDKTLYAKGRKGLYFALLCALLVGFSICALTGFAGAEDRATRVITFLSSGNHTAGAGQSTGFNVSAYYEGLVLVNVTADPNNSTLSNIIEISDDNTTWYTHTTMSQITTTGKYKQTIANFGKYMRINYTVGGTNCTFGITGVFKN